MDLFVLYVVLTPKIFFSSSSWDKQYRLGWRRLDGAATAAAAAAG